MYLPAEFAETRGAVLRPFIREHPFATLVVSTGQGPDAEHLPLLLVEHGPHGTLQGHVARANPVWREVADGAEVLAVFQGPDHYVSPGWYPSKRRHGKAVPTWNYAVVHARGRLRWQHDRAWLRAFLERLTQAEEQGRAEPWGIGDAPADFIERMLTAVVGLEIALSSLEGKWKLSQNRETADRKGVVTGLEQEPGGRGAALARLMRDQGG